MKHGVPTRLYRVMQAERVASAEAPVHFIVPTSGGSWREREREHMMARLCAAIVENTAWLGRGTRFRRAKRFYPASEHPIDIMIDIGFAAGDLERIAFVTRGMRAHGCDELHVTAPLRGRGAIELVFCVARWLLADPERPVCDGDTLGRNDDERIAIVRSATAIRLDLP